MRVFYTFLASGLLILTKSPQEIASPSLDYYTGDAVTQFTEPYLENFEVGQQPLLEHKLLQDGLELLPLETKATPTTIPKQSSVENALATYRQQSTLPITGYAMYYNPNVMQEVINNRIKMGHISPCSECIGNVALLRAGDLNRRVWLQWGDGVVEGPFLVADVAATHHVAQLLARNWVVDVDNRTAVRRRMAGPVLVTVWASPPASQQNAAPFAPLYSTVPIFTPTPNQPPATQVPLVIQPAATPQSPVVTMPSAIPVIQQVGFPTTTPVPAVTPLPAINGAHSKSTAIEDGFPVGTPVPTMTPLPGIQTMPLATTFVLQVAAPTSVPIVAHTVTHTATHTATATPTPFATGAPVATQGATAAQVQLVMQAGFPADTPVPTITPLPAIN